jgi:hypothetical protein
MCAAGTDSTLRAEKDESTFSISFSSKISERGCPVDSFETRRQVTLESEPSIVRKAWREVKLP